MRSFLLVLILGLGTTAQTTVVTTDPDRIDLHERVREFEARLAAGQFREALSSLPSLRDEAVVPENEATGGPDPGRSSQRLLPAPDEPGLELSVDLWLDLRLAGLSAAGRAVHEEIRLAACREDFERALRTEDWAALARIARRDAPLDPAMDARLVLAELDLEAGRFGAALRRFLAVLDLIPADSPRRGRALAGAALAALRSGDLRLAALLGDDPAAHRQIEFGGERVVLADHLTAHSAAPRAPFESPEGFEEVWCVALGAKEDSTPAAFPPVPRLFGMTAIWHDEEALRAVSLEDGRPLWTLTFGVGDETSPRLPKPTAGDLSGLGGLGVDGLYFFVTREDRGPTGGDGELVAVDATDGRIIWRRAPSPRRPDGIRPRFDPDPVAIDGRIFVSSIEPGTPMRSWLQAFRVTDGKELWTLQVGSGMPLPWIGPGSRSLHDEDLVSAQPAAIAGGTLLLADSLGTLAAVDPQTGAVDWVYHYPRLQVPDDVRAVPRGFNRETLRVSGDHLALAADDGAGLQFLYTRPQRLTAEGRFGVGLLCDSWPRDGLATLVDFDGRTALVSGPLLGEGMDLVRAFSPWSTERLEPWDQPMALARPIRGRCLRVGNEVYVSCAPIVYRLDGRVGAASKPLFSCPTSESKLTYGLTAVPGGLLLSNPRAVRFLRARAP